ncbi:MAG: alpha/beta hydrolase, partial [Alphaproteobacteria bacterium]|nr:alpha/beta hydrolase [Alphaproteobacteria bacterium]
LIFMHGVGATHDMWKGWLPALVDKYRIILIATRGCGKSAGIGNYNEWTLDGLSDDILRVADHAGVGTFHAVGESAGGTAVLNLVCRGLDRVASATTLSTAHRGGQIARVRQWRSDIERNGVAWWSGEMMKHRFVDGAVAEQKYAWFRERQDAAVAEALLRKGDVLLATDLTPELAGIRCPLLMMAPDHSPFVTPDIPVEILSHVPHAKLSIIPNSKHGIFFSHDAACARLLAEFLGCSS